MTTVIIYVEISDVVPPRDGVVWVIVFICLLWHNKESSSWSYINLSMPLIIETLCLQDTQKSNG